MTRVNSRSEVAGSKSAEAAKSRSAAPQTASTCAGQLLAERRQRVLAVLADQQLVAEVPAQPGQRRARGRLGYPEPLGGARDAPLPRQFAQRDEQVQVKVGEMGDRPNDSTIKRPASVGRKM
jgi:uncharacterized protein (DUF3084 family)